MASETYPFYPNSVILPTLAFPSWILCIPPMIWHFSQRNVAAWSLMLWVIMINFCNSINPLIWPRDNLDEWYDGNVLCDIQSRIFVGSNVSQAACVAMILRKLAKVMDTRNITVAPNRSKRIREKALEALWCWGYPVFLMLIYYIVQPARYYIYGIAGCVTIFNSSWVSIVILLMWSPITICVAAYFGGLLVYRLHRYRREFHRLIAARNTTKSRFIRLFLMSMIIIVIFLPYNFWLLWLNVSNLNEPFSWSYVHGSDWNTVWKVPSDGVVRLDKWGQVATGYLGFIVFGTGTDANNTYKRMLCAIGLGRIFPSLYRVSESGTSTPSSITFARGFASTCSSKAKKWFSRSCSITETQHASTRNNSVTADTILLSTPRSASIPWHPVQSNEPILRHPSPKSAPKKSFWGRLFARRNTQKQILPLFTGTTDQATETEKSLANTTPSGIYSHAWASDSPTTTHTRESEADHGVCIVREVHQNHKEQRGTEEDVDALP